MNEWSPGGNHIRPETSKRTVGSLRSQWDESENGSRTGTLGLRATSDNRNKSRHQQFKEDISKTSLNICSKKSKTGDSFVTSDPRFKRIISPGNQTKICIGTETKKSKSTLDLKDAFKSKPADWNPPEFKPKKPLGDSAENTTNLKAEPPFLDLQPKKIDSLEPLKLEPSQDNLKLVEKLGFDHILAESFSKESLSDSCISTRNASLASEESGPDFSNKLEAFSSATRFKKVQHWIQDQQGKPEKRQSVVTVIGQTQGSDTLSSALQEIDKRRKLVKELDKYAVCRKILDSEKDNDLSELLTKINYFTETGKMWFFGGSSENEKINLNTQKTFDDLQIDKEKMDADNKTKLKECNFESVKKGAKKAESITTYFKGRILYQWIFCALIILCVVLCALVYVTIQRNRYMSFDLFTPKPKPLKWYEKIGMWIWELFRPSANFQRTVPWQQYLN